MKIGLENISILQNKTEAKTKTYHHNTNPDETKDSFYITCYKFHFQPSEFTGHQGQNRRGRI
jgi:hypothetical protein